MTTTPADTTPRAGVPVPVTVAVVVVCLVLGMASLASAGVLAFALAGAVVLVAWGWAGALALPTPRGTVGTIVVGGLALVAAVGLPDEGPWLSWVPAALALAMLAAFVHQLLRRDGRPRVVQSVSAVVLALGLLACGVLLVPLTRTEAGTELVIGALAAALASSVSDLAGRWPGLAGWLTPLALTVGGAAAVLVALVMEAEWTTWLLLGVASAALSHALRAVLGPLPAMSQPRPRLVAALTSVLVVGVVPYLVAGALVPDALL
ncbi:hypothetical protein [Ornithinimicrobium cerasi]|uniref:hypothetical protein n=1 Tax=Ornithinimicrobium cerasi TaxID=2248773 RepID=UPI000EFE00E6|nr:hypothetical protein [Ornithinimicrobium cerasi]